MFVFVSGCGKLSVLRFEAEKSDETRTVKGTESNGNGQSPIIFKFSFLDFSSFKFHSEVFVPSVFVFVFKSVRLG